MDNEIALYGLSADGGVTFWTDGGKRMPHWHTESGVKFLNESLDAANNANFSYRFHRICSLPAALNAEKNEKAVAAAREYMEAVEAKYPSYEEGAAAQDAWATRISKAREELRAALNPKEGE